MESAVFTIGRLARSANVPTSVVRYYERRGLLRPDERSAGNYRLYGVAALERLRFIRAAQEAGFTLKDITALTRIEDGPGSACAPVRGLIEARLTAVTLEIDHLLYVRKVLTGWQAECRRAERTGRCPMLHGLHREARQTPGPKSGKLSQR
jgi:DNA-binding transcriptional MerR regulator